MKQLTELSRTVAPAQYAGLLPPVEALHAGFVMQAVTSPAPQPSQESAALRSQLAIAASVGNVDWVSDRQQRQGFAIGDLRIMIGYGDGSELTDLPEVFWVPNAPDWLLGVVNLHGLIVPVFDLNIYLGAGRLSDAPRPSRLLVLGHGADAAGILIDDLPQRLSWGDGDGGTTASTALAPEHVRPFLKEVRIIDGKMWFDLDVPVLLDALEQAFVS